jgi:amino acid adenylation domain-containing protein
MRNSERNGDSFMSITHLFQCQVQRTPSAPALIGSDKQISYAELDVLSDQLAGFLVHRYGMGPDCIVALHIERSIAMVVGLLGILKAGAAYLPLDPNGPGERLRCMLADAHPSVILTQQKLEKSLPAGAPATLRLDLDWHIIEGERRAAPRAQSGAENLAYVIYTSGSTGKPKGVMVPHRALTNHMLWMREAFPLSAQDVVLQKTPLVFDASIWEILAPLICGAQLLLGRPDGHKDVDYLVEAITSHQVTTVQFVPSLLRVFLESPEVGRCTSLRNVFSGGEALTAELRDRFFARLASAELHNLYGPSETCIQSLVYSCRRDELAAPGPVPIGRPITHTQAYVLDERLEKAPPGTEGELYIGGDCLARGYLGREDLTRERFICNPFASPGARLYRTGDRARCLPDGNFVYLGRTDRQVKLGGQRVELEEIEAALLAHPRVREAAVSSSGESAAGKRLVAHVVAAAGPSPDAATLRDHLRQHLTEIMIPSVFVMLPQLPRLPGGKIDWQGLATPTPAMTGACADVGLSRTQLLLVQTWRDILGLPDVGLDEEFFDLGGNSIELILMFARVNSSLGTSVGIETVTRGATIAQLAPAFDAAVLRLASIPSCQQTR